MILEVTTLPIRPGEMDRFFGGWSRAEPVLAAQPGYVAHTIGINVEEPDKVTLLITWRTLEAHTELFAKSKDFPIFIDCFSRHIDGEAEIFHVAKRGT